MDLSKFEITNYKDGAIYKIIRDENENSNKRTRPIYSGPSEAFFYVFEQQSTLSNQRFIEDFQI